MGQSVFTCSVEETSHHEAICRTFFDPGQCHGSSLWYHCSRWCCCNSRCCVQHCWSSSDSVPWTISSCHPPSEGRTCGAPPCQLCGSSCPAPYTTTAQGPGVTTIHQQAPVVTKQVHYGT